MTAACWRCWRPRPDPDPNPNPTPTKTRRRPRRPSATELERSATDRANPWPGHAPCVPCARAHGAQLLLRLDAFPPGQEPEELDSTGRAVHGGRPLSYRVDHSEPAKSKPLVRSWRDRPRPTRRDRRQPARPLHTFPPWTSGLPTPLRRGDPPLTMSSASFAEAFSGPMALSRSGRAPPPHRRGPDMTAGRPSDAAPRRASCCV